MKTRRIVPILALVLALLLLQGCVRTELPVFSGLPHTKPEQAEATQAVDYETPVRYFDYGYRDYLGHKRVPMIRFGEMAYQRPDLDAMTRSFDALIAQTAAEDDAEALLDGYFRIYDDYTEFYTMEALADLRYCLNESDDYYRAEYEYCLSAEADVEQKMEELYKAFAASQCRAALELAYFGRGFFEYYDEHEYYTNETVLALSRREAELLVRYRAVLEAPTVTIDGEERLYNELLQTDDWDEYDRVQRAYYRKYNPILGEIYLELVKTRRQIAETLGFSRYDEYAFSVSYERDYSPQEADAFLSGIRSELVPLYAAIDPGSAAILSSAIYGEDAVRAVVKSAAKSMGGPIWEAYRFMDAYDLSDLTQAGEKTDISFVTYLYSWEAPFLTVNATGYEDDVTSFAHEFGHFVDSYYTYNADEDLETSETFSQAMEYLALCCSDELGSPARKRLLRAKLEDTLSTFVEQAAYADFESRVYALPADELSLDRINGLYNAVCREYGVYAEDYDDYYSYGWIDVLHFFEMPFYVVSYCVSADTSLQIYELETQEEGCGLDAYLWLLEREYGAGIQQVAQDAGLENPFGSGRLAKDAEFLRAELGIK